MKIIRIGVFGVRRGSDFFKSILSNDGEIVAICEKNPERVEAALKQLGNNVAVYDNFDEFIEHPMDAVLLANYFHEHTEYAIKCLERNIHVLSECTSNATMAEGVALVRAAEKSKAPRVPLTIPTGARSDVYRNSLSPVPAAPVVHS